MEEFAQPAVTILAVSICFGLWLLVARPLPTVVALGPATPLPEAARPVGPRPSPRPVKVSQPMTLSVADEVNARKIYARACAACHASGGPHDLSRTSLYRHGSDDQAIFRNIKTGIPGTPMGGTSLSDATVWGLVYYLSKNRI